MKVSISAGVNMPSTIPRGRAGVKDKCPALPNGVDVTEKGWTSSADVLFGCPA